MTKTLAPTPPTKLSLPTRIDAWLPQYPPELDALWLEVRSIHAWNVNWVSEQLRNTRRYFRIGAIRRDLQPLDDYITTVSARGYNVFLLRNPVYRRQRRSSRASNVARITSFALDLDGITPDDGRQVLRDAGLPTPSLLVSTGHGVHAHFFVDPPLSTRTGAQYLSEFVRTWATHPMLVPYVDDKVSDPARVLRVPSLNFKDLNSTNPSRDDLLDYSIEEHLCYVVNSHPQCSYGLHDLLPHIGELESREIYNRDIEVIQEQDDEEDLHSQGVGRVGTKGRGTSSLSPSPIPSPISSCTVSGEERTRPQIQQDEVDYEHLKAIIERIQVRGPGDRNNALSRYVAALRKSFADLKPEQLREFHRRWYERWRPKMSGSHSEQASYGQFESCWRNMPHQYRTSEAWLAELDANLSLHPRRDRLPQGNRWVHLRRLADLMWTACQRGGGTCAFSVRLAAIALGIKKSAANSAINRLIREDLIETISLGSRATGRASEYRIPPGKKPGS